MLRKYQQQLTTVKKNGGDGRWAAWVKERLGWGVSICKSAW